MWSQRSTQLALIATMVVLSACSEQHQDTTVQTTEGDRISATVETSQASELSTDESAAVAKAAGRVMLHATQARTALTDKNIPEAKDNIAKGLQLLDIINEALPEYKVTSKITAGDLAYNDESIVKPGRVPVYEYYGELSTANEVVGSEGQQADDAVVSDVADYTSSALLDVHTARTFFNAANAALEEDNLSAAQAHLAGVFGAISFEIAEVHRPLVAARENLILAKDEVADLRWRAARIALETASTEITEQAARESGEDANALHEMAIMVKALAEDIEADATTAAASIDEWYDQLAKMK